MSTYLASISALSNFSDHKVHDLAKNILQQNDWEKASFGLILFVNNYHYGDHELIHKFMQRIPANSEPYIIHYIACDLIDIFEKNHCEYLNDILIWVYENSPCMVCRTKIVKLLIDNNIFSDDLLHECLFDGYE